MSAGARMLLAALSPEAQLLLASGRVGDGGAERVESLVRSGVRWDRLLWLARQEKAAPAVLRRLSALPAGVVPPERLAQLRKLAMVVEFRTLHVQQRLAEVVEALDAAGIEAVLLKGAALGSTVYRSFVDRPMGDIDLLVAPADARRAREVLLGAGWVWDQAHWQDEHYRDHHHLPPLTDSRDGATRLELHTELFIGGHPFGLTGERVRGGARQVAARGRCLRVPSQLHLLLHACLHFAWSHNMRLASWRAFRDVEALTRNGAVDWEELVAEARANRAGTCCFWTLRLARDLMDVSVPAATLAALRPPLPEGVVRRLERHFVVQLFPTEPACPSIRVEKLLWSAGVMPRWSGHGRARPWMEADALLEKRQGAPGGSEGARPSKAVRQLRNLERWTRYVRAVLAPALSK